MGLMDKFKNLFTEEVEDDEPIKKEVIQVEIPSPKEMKKEKKERRAVSDELETLEETPIMDEEPKFEPVKIKEEKEEYKFPFFDDEDFEVIEERRETKREKKPLYSSKKETAYNPQKEEKHTFKPTPIISPVYGILDKNYVKEDIKSRASKPSSYYKEATIDDIRNKAYGTLEEDVASELYDEDRALYEPVVEDKSEDLFVEMDRQAPAKVGDEHVARHAKVEEKRGDELTSLLEQEMSKEQGETRQPAKISDQELFSLIDSMYERGDK